MFRPTCSGPSGATRSVNGPFAEPRYTKIAIPAAYCLVLVNVIRPAIMDADFFLAGGIAFLPTLVGWGDQIRGAQEKTRQQEKEFLTT